MEDRDVFDSQPGSLARMMDLGEEDQGLWSPEELEAVFEHQLSAPVEFDFSYVSSGASGRLDMLRRTTSPPIKSFRDLLHHPCPPVELLKTTKEFAKTCRSRPQCRLPDEVATMLYILSIVAARTKAGHEISQLDAQGLRLILDWALEQSWVDAPTRALLLSGYQAIGGEPESDV